MTTHTIKLPDVGEGVTEAEFVEVYVKVGDEIEADQNLADVMTDKATVEVPSPRTGTVTWIGAEPGDVIAVGAEIIKIAVKGEGDAEKAPPPAEDLGAESAAAEETALPTEDNVSPELETKAPHPEEYANTASSQKVLAAPAVRARALTKGVSLENVTGTGPEGRILHRDLEAYDGKGGSNGAQKLKNRAVSDATETIKIIGLRRKIAEKMQEAKQHIPHITYVDEVLMDPAEDLRQHMNSRRRDGQPKLTALPFIVRATVCALREFPQMNARYDDEAGEVVRHSGVHMGIATQTDNGLMVPVLRHAEDLDLFAIAEGVKRLSAAARDGSAAREELSGSTITITSLGPLGGVTTTPIINRPEVAIVGPNAIRRLPRYRSDGTIEPQRVMNLSSSFDHRIIDGYEAAEFVQSIKAYLENPATMFMDMG